MVREVVSRIIEETGSIEGVLNNAGIGYAGAFENASLDDVKKVFETNVYGTMLVCQEVLPYMRDQRHGYIMNISTMGSVMGLPFRAFYSASKAAVDMMTETIRLEVRRFGIEVCLIHPGDVKTDIGKNRIVSAPDNDLVYGKIFDKTYKKIDSDVETGLPPEVFGPLVEKILNTRNVRRNYYVGNLTQKLGMRVKKVFPDKIFEKIIMSYYKAED
jgi:NAD(P)-dependent dehydrogenase (short-subunit alcohol dehydrogenase family)